MLGCLTDFVREITLPFLRRRKRNTTELKKPLQTAISPLSDISRKETEILQQTIKDTEAKSSQKVSDKRKTKRKAKNEKKAKKESKDQVKKDEKKAKKVSKDRKDKATKDKATKENATKDKATKDKVKKDAKIYDKPHKIHKDDKTNSDDSIDVKKLIKHKNSKLKLVNRTNLNEACKLFSLYKSTSEDALNTDTITNQNSTHKKDNEAKQDQNTDSFSLNSYSDKSNNKSMSERPFDHLSLQDDTNSQNSNKIKTEIDNNKNKITNYSSIVSDYKEVENSDLYNKAIYTKMIEYLNACNKVTKENENTTRDVFNE